MPVVFPGTPPGSAFDTFAIPSAPEGTPLSEAGAGNVRNHPELHDDIGRAIQALQAWTSLRVHNHDGTDTITGGPKLTQACTHENADTDSSPNAIHHTLGTGPNQAMPGSHVVNYGDLTGAPYVICTSTTRPSSPFIGQMIFETDTNFIRIWSLLPLVYPTATWHLIPFILPVCRLIQTQPQNLSPGNNAMIWNQVIEDNNNFITGDPTAIFLKDGGLYHIDCAVQWSTNEVPDSCYLSLQANGSETVMRENRFQRGENYKPGFSQTLSMSGKLRFNPGDIVRVNVSFSASQGLIGKIITFFEDLAADIENIFKPGHVAQYAFITSRVELCYLSP